MSRPLTCGIAIAIPVIVLVAIASSFNLPARAMARGLPQCQHWGEFGLSKLWVSPAFAQDNTLFAVGDSPPGYTFTNPYLKSLDGGLSWSEMPITTTTIGDMAFSPDYLHDQTIYLAYHDTNNLLRSMDSSQTWVIISTLYNQGVPSLAVVATNTLFLGLGGGPPYMDPQQGLFYAEDGGQTWERLYQGGVTDVAISPNYIEDHAVFMGIGGYHWNGGILKSTDSGHTWQPSREGLAWGSDGVTTDITFSPGYTQDHTMFAVSWGWLYKSTDEGAHWTKLPTLPRPTPGGTTTYFVMSPRYPEDQTLWLAGYVEGNLVSTDGGRTWRALPEAVVPIAAGAYCSPGSLSLCRIELFGYAWDKDYHDYMYKSFDSGMTWQCLESDYTPLPMLRRAFLPMVSKP
jgi:photosystem II stability/assembly factor-like uncharacterized protein